jgi:hypothetical protein
MIVHKNEFNDYGRIKTINIELQRDEEGNVIPNVDFGYEIGRVDKEENWHNQGVTHIHFDGKDAENVLLGLRTRDGVKKLYKSVEDMLTRRDLVDRP